VTFLSSSQRKAGIYKTGEEVNSMATPKPFIFSKEVWTEIAPTEKMKAKGTDGWDLKAIIKDENGKYVHEFSKTMS
jgi:hypothetical protein